MRKAACLQSLFRSATEDTLALLSPNVCVYCLDRLDFDFPVCRACLDEIESPTDRDCLARVAEARREGLQLDKLFALWFYDEDGPAQAVHNAFKYGERPAYALAIGRRMAQMMPQDMREASLLVPVPLHWTRRARRGYNQSEWLCRGIASVTGGEIRHALRRASRTCSQTTLGRIDRVSNVRDAFRPIGHPVVDESVLLVDDVLTTGATLSACVRALRSAGFAEIRTIVMALARIV